MDRGHNCRPSWQKEVAQFANMWVLVLILSVLATDVFGQGPAHRPTGGEAWPKPRHEKKGRALIIDSPQMKYKFLGPLGPWDKLLEAAIERLNTNIVILIDIARQFCGHEQSPSSNNTLMELHINLTDPAPGDLYPHFNMNESYRLNVTRLSDGRILSVVSAVEVWGVIQGLETLSQLYYLSEDYKHVLINETSIKDYPNYKHRGLLLDTSRHYLEYPYILKTLDAMAMNKLNVLHWHIVDDQSFPYKSELFPELSQKGAYWPTLVYTRPVMQKIREHARYLGIRVVVEIDMPDHAKSWGVSHPEILTQCNGRLGPMNPIKEETYALLGPLLGEVQELFPDAFIHLGSDEVSTQCWLRNKKIREYMAKHNMSSAKDLSALFYNRTAALLKNNTVTIVWEDSYHADIPLPRNTLVQVWRDTNNAVDILKKGRFVIQSAPFYLNQMKTTFSQHYVEEPRLAAARQLSRHHVTNATLLDNIVGGEACMWGEMVDSANVISRVWPRASAMAEVLWSETHGKISAHVLARAEEHACRMKRRGIHAEPPSGPGFCVLKTGVDALR